MDNILSKSKFCGDVLITDPCYVVKERDWERSKFGAHMKELGIKNYLYEGTVYGDWSCTTFKGSRPKVLDEEELEYMDILGRFCADAGLVSVFLLSEVLAYNPKYDDHLTKPHVVTWIKDFNGEIAICREGEEVWVEGKGKDSEDRVIEFFTAQTGF